MDFITDLPPNIKLRVKILLIITDRLSKGIILIPIVTGRVACKQMTPMDERRSIEGEGKEKNLTGQVVTAIYIKRRGAPT